MSRAGWALIILILCATPALGAIVNDGDLDLSWDASKGEAGVDYQFRLQHFASGGQWTPLCNAASVQGAITCQYAPPLLTEGGDNWVCVDARGWRDGITGPWLSSLPSGPVCNQFAAAGEPAPIPIPPPPSPTPTLDERVTALEERAITLLALINDLAAKPDRTDDTVLRQILRDVLANECAKSCSGTVLLKAIVKRLPP
jgi:hypothetical protein